MEQTKQRHLISELEWEPSFDAFRARFLVETESGCLEWRRAAHERGYGRLRWQGKVRSAHRVAWELARRQRVPDDLVIRHLCANPSCCNPDHLRIGTPAENSFDNKPKIGRKPLAQQIAALERREEVLQLNLARCRAKLERLRRLRDSLPRYPSDSDDSRARS